MLFVNMLIAGYKRDISETLSSETSIGGPLMGTFWILQKMVKCPFVLKSGTIC